MTKPADLADSHSGQGPNMTPMIDIVFNLVTFFLLSVDMSRRDYQALSLPRAAHGLQDHVDAPGEVARLVVNLLGDGSVSLRGRTYVLGATDRVEVARALADLTADLSLYARSAAREPDGASAATVLVRGDRVARWKYVQWVMQACADPNVRITRIQFAVEEKNTNQRPR